MPNDNGLLYQRIAQLGTDNIKLVELLKKTEWMLIVDEYPVCWSCHNVQDFGHAPNCELNELLSKRRD